MRKDDGDTGALMPWIRASSAQGSGSSYEDNGHSGDWPSYGDDPGGRPDEAADDTGYVEDCHGYSDEDYGGYSDDDDDDGYDYYN